MDYVVIITVGIVGYILLQGMRLLSRDLRELTRQLRKVRTSQTWSKKRELETNKILKKISKRFI